MNVKCVVVDDEPLAIEVLKGHLRKIPYIDVVGTFTSAIDVYELLNEQEIDLLFLDIEMPDLSGLDFLRSLTFRPSVIITSANKSYALEGFELHVDDYLIKPVSFNRLVKSINRVIELRNKESDSSGEIPSPDYIYVKENKRMVKIYLDNILYVESVKDYVKIVTNRKTVITKKQLNAFEDFLKGDKFLRIHRSFIVALNKIDAYSATTVDISNTELPIGRKYKEDVLQELEKLGKFE